jgi:hypothetical protein
LGLDGTAVHPAVDQENAIVKASNRSFFIGCFVVLFVAGLAAQVPQLTPFTADMQMTSSRSEGQRQMNGKMYVGQGAMRMDMQGEGPRQAVMITHFATQTTDMLMPQQHMYMEFKADENRMHRGPNTSDMHPFDPGNPCASQPDLTCKKIGSETVNGRTCDHWQLTHKDGSVSNVWIDQKLHFPIRSATEDSTWNLTNIKEGDPAASLFEIPAGYQKMDMSNMMRGMPQGGMPPQH